MPPSVSITLSCVNDFVDDMIIPDPRAAMNNKKHRKPTRKGEARTRVGIPTATRSNNRFKGAGGVNDAKLFDFEPHKFGYMKAHWVQIQFRP